MDAPSPTPRWPHYEKRCRDWTEALKRLDGEFRRDTGGNRHLGWMVGTFATLGASLLWATTLGPYATRAAPYVWLMPTTALVLIGLALVIARRTFGVRYRFTKGEVAEVTAGGRIKWRESLLMLQGVTFPWRAQHFPQMLDLHWTAHHRTIELYQSIEAAVDEILRANREVPGEPAERQWSCDACRESNPESFEICWKCGTAAAP